MKTRTRVAARRASLILCALAVLALVAVRPAQAAIVSAWNADAADVWSNAARWTAGIPTAAGDTANLTFNIAGDRIITIDGAIASRTLGILNIGDTNNTHFYTLAATGGGTLTFDNGGPNAQLNQNNTSKVNVISAPILLNSSLDISNADADGLTVSGTITANSAGTKTISNLGAGAGAVTLSNVIADGGGGTVAILQNSATSQLILSYNANQFTGTTLISNGKVKLGAQYALWKSPYDTTGSTGAIGLDVTGQVAPVLGGLAGGVNLATGVTAYGSVTGLTLNPQTGASNTYSGIIANGAANMTLTKTGYGTQTLTGANSYSGATTIYAGTLALAGASGTALNSAFTVKGGTLSLDNSAAWADRLADGTALSLGSLTLTSSNVAGIQSETVGATTFATGGKVTINNGATLGDQTTLALGAVTRSAGAAIDFVGTGGTVGILGSGADSPNVTSTGAFPGTQNGILPWATVGGTKWAEDNANSIRAYSGLFTTLAAATSTTQAQQTGAASPAGSAIATNSLNVISDGSSNILDLGNNVVSFGNTTTTLAAILKSGANAYTISASGTGSLRAGTAGAGTELIAHVDGGDLTISAPLNTAILGIAKGGAGNLILSGTRAATFSGAIGITGNLEFQGNSTTLSGAISGPGGITVNLNTGQKLVFTGYNKKYSGPTVVKGGILQLGTAWDNQSWSTIGTSGGAGGGDYSGVHQNGLSNLELNGGSATIFYYTSWFLGSGPGEIKLTGGASGFSMGNGGGNAANTLTFNSGTNYEVVWGALGEGAATGYFNPSTLVLNDDAATPTSHFRIPNKFDLNGATRTIAVNSTTQPGGLLGVIRNSTGTAGITKTGVGELYLTAANTFNGVVTVNQGMLSVAVLANGGAASGLGTSSNAAANVLLANGTTLKYTGGAVSTNRSFTINGTNPGDSASLDASGTGAINFTSTSSPAYGTTAQTRTLILTGTSTFTNTLAANIADNGTGAVSVTKTGAGLWVLSGTNSYTGPTTLSAGTLSAGLTANLGGSASNLVFNGGTLQVTGTTLTNFSGIGHTVSFTAGQTVGLDINNAGNIFTADQVLNQGVGGLTKLGAGTLVLNQANTYTGQTTISAGTLRLDDGGAMSPAPLLDNGTFAVNRSGTVTQGTDFPAIIGGTGSVANVGAGTLVLNAPTYYTGTTKATAGTITLSHALAIQNSALDTTGAGAVTLSGVTTPTFGGLSGASGNLATVISSGYTGSVSALTLNPSGTVTYGGVIANGAANMTLTKTGAGTQVLQGASTYSGATTLNAGTLTLSGAAGALTATSGITLAGGTLQLTNTTSAEGAVDRVPSVGITSNGGAITYTNTATSGFTYAETLGELTLTSGQLTVTNTNAATGIGTESLTFANGGSGLADHTANTSTVAFIGGGNLGTATTNRILINNQPNTAAGAIIGAWATAGVGTTAGDYAAYGANGITPRAAAATTGDGTWNTVWANDATGNVNFANVTTGTTLTNNRVLNTLRHTGGAETLALSTFNLTTQGILQGGTGLLTISGAGGAITAGGNPDYLLYVTTGTAQGITISAPINNNGATAVTLVKSGSNTLTLSSTTSTYGGGTVLNAGTVSVSADTNLGAAGSTITFNGSAQLNNGGASDTTLNLGSRPFTLNNGAIATFNATRGQNFQTSGAVTGSGGVSITSSGGNTHTLSLLSTANNFTGPINNSNGDTTTILVNSISDSSSPITLGGGGGTFTYGSGAIVPLTLNNRQFLLTGGATINNSSTQSLTINTDIGFSGTGARGLTLSAVAGPTNVFSGRLTDNAGGAFSLTKSGAGTWTLSGTNTYTGQTTINDTGGTMYFQNASNSLPAASTVWIGGSAGMRLLDDGAGTINLGNNVQVGVAGTGERDGPTFFIGNNNTANGGNSSGTTTGSTIALGAFDLTYGDNRSTQILNITGANGYRLQIAGLTIAKRADYGKPQLNPTTAPLTITGTVTMASGKLATDSTNGDTLELMGTATGNLISGAIKDAADYPTNPNAKPLNITKSGTGTWVLTGVNTYTGATSISDGTLEIGGAGQLGSGNYAGAIAIAAAKTFKYNSSAAQTLSGIIGTAATAGILVKDGAGTLTLTNANIYTGATTINAGKLKIDTAGTINTTSSLTINGPTAEFMYNNSTNAFNKPITFTQGTLSGTGTIAKAVTVGSGAILSPGGSPGTLTVNNAIETWASGGKYAWQLLDATGTAGTGFDLADITGTGYLAVTATSGSPFNVVLQTLSSTGPDVQGTPLNWDPNTYYQSWKIASSATAITGWDVDDGLASALFAIDATNFVGAHPTATFSVSKTGNDVYLNYVPEPATLALLGLGGLGLILSRKRK